MIDKDFYLHWLIVESLKLNPVATDLLAHFNVRMIAAAAAYKSQNKYMHKGEISYIAS